MRSFLFIVVVCVTLGGAGAATTADEPPKSLDNRLTFELFAEQPRIVTPTGIAVDARGRVLVIESHTHFRPEGYQGPAADRIRMFEDTDRDGRADRITTFFEGTTYTMNVAVYRDGSVYVATRNELFRLRDTDDDGRSDQRTRIARLETDGNYPHNGLSGFAFDLEGNVYFGLGENLGADYQLIGSDGVTLSGGGEGGSMYRCRADGSRLERIATGFWNPFHLCLDGDEQLFAVDNDPDWRPPCRLLHIVPGGDYGYQYRLGRRGTHPFTSWFGELPGTLGMVAGTGEAPSGVIACQSDMLPADYHGNLLVTSWGVHAIERYRLEPHGASFRSTAETIVKGDDNFRPVGIARAPDGSYYISDWVDRSYKLHGRGRIWRLAAKKPGEPNRVASPVEHMREVLNSPKTTRHSLANLMANAPPAVRELAVRMAPAEWLDLATLAGADGSKLVRAAALRRLDAADNRETLFDALGDDDPFVRQAARHSIEKTLPVDDVVRLDLPAEAARRVETALLLRGTSDPRAVQRLPSLLTDENDDVRFIAVRWIGEDGLGQFKPQLEGALNAGDVSGRFFEAYFACLAMLAKDIDPMKFEAEQRQLVAQWLVDRSNTSPEVLKLALRKVSGEPGEEISESERRRLLETMLDFIDDRDPQVRVEAIRSAREISGSSRLFHASRIARIVADGDQPEVVRAEAAASFPAGEQDVSLLLDILAQGDVEVRRELLRSSRASVLTEKDRQRLVRVRAEFPDTSELVDRLLDKDWKPRNRPDRDDIERWLAITASGDATAGERLFFHPQGPRCYACHRVDGRGGLVGPDLSSAGRLGARRLIESLLAPSREMAPQFVPWTIQTTDGRVVTGVLIGERGEEEIYADSEGRRFRVQHSAIEARLPLGKSIMPDGLVNSMTDRELRDVMAFLRSRR